MSTRKYPAPPAVPQRIYQLHVSLVDIQPTVWRRLWVADTLTLAKLDRVIQAAMGWTNSHLHEFVIAGRRYGIPDEEWPEAVPTLDERRFDVGAVLAGEVGEFTYTYDFGDGWQHAVKVEQAMFPNDLNIRPVCLAGQNACPPEDVGGAGGYINVGTGQGHSVLELVRAFEVASGRPVPYTFAQRRMGDVAACYANADNANQKLGWQAQLTLEDMCADTWRWQSGTL